MNAAGQCSTIVCFATIQYHMNSAAASNNQQPDLTSLETANNTAHWRSRDRGPSAAAAARACRTISAHIGRGRKRGLPLHSCIVQRREEDAKVGVAHVGRFHVSGLWGKALLRAQAPSPLTGTSSMLDKWIQRGRST
jgi:hypothetical protein